MNNKLLLFLALAILASCQKDEPFIEPSTPITQNTWVLEHEKMSGIGKHESLPNGTTLQFNDDGTWLTSSAINSLKADSGLWNVSTEGLSISVPNSDVEIETTSWTNDQLIFKVKESSRSYRYEWKSQP